MKIPLDFIDPGASDGEPAKGVTNGCLRQWHDEIEKLKADCGHWAANYDELNKTLLAERAEFAKRLKPLADVMARWGVEDHVIECNSNADDWHRFLSERLDARANFPNALVSVSLRIADVIEEIRRGDRIASSVASEKTS